MKTILLSCFIGITLFGFTQTNILITNAEANDVLMGNYDPANYAAATVIDSKMAIVQGINSNVNADSLKVYIEKMGTFVNRNTGSDTTSNMIGIGAARRWAFDKFESFNAFNDNRLVISYVQFDQVICSVNQHRNIMAVLPGTDTANYEIVLIEGHIDSRCDDACDSLCLAEGMEDNATGSALVLELARVMSQYTYKNTIIFMLTIGEEQGLYGANALSQYSEENNLPIKAVFNNDVVGGVICGETSSAPSCPGLNDVDSLSVRFFSFGGTNSYHKQLARFSKLEYQEELLSMVAVPMSIHIMSGEDRIGRGGDHIPFRQDGFTAMRCTSANEHGDASNSPGYTDRQHTSDDILGIDTDGDFIIDSFFVDFNYLARNSVINGNAASMVAIGPRTPDFTFASPNDSSLTVTIIDQTQYPNYRIALRTISNDWDTVYTTNSLVTTINLPPATWYYVSTASVDDSGVESLFSYESSIYSGWLTIEDADNQESLFEEKAVNYQLLQNYPNPFDESTIIAVYVANSADYNEASIVIRDLGGKIIQTLPLELNSEMNEVNYEHGYGTTGVYSYTLIVDGEEISTKRMIFAN